MNEMNLTNLSALNDVLDFLVVRRGAMLHTGLNNAVRSTGSFNHGSPFTDRQSQGFLHVNILARLAGQNGWHGVPVIGRSDVDGMNIIAFEDPPKIFVGLGSVRSKTFPG